MLPGLSVVPAYAHHKVYASVFYQTYVSAGPSVVRDTDEASVLKGRDGRNPIRNIHVRECGEDFVAVLPKGYLRNGEADGCNQAECS